MNILLHAGNAFLVYRLALTCSSHKYVALAAGLLFALHPVNTEAVNFLSTRNSLLSSFFILVAYLLHYRSVMKGNISRAIAGAFFFMAGIFSKEVAAAILPFIIALEAAHMREGATGAGVRAALRLFPYAVATGIYILMRWMTLSKIGIQTSIIPGFGSGSMHGLYKIPDLWTRLQDNLYIIPQYFISLISPTSLSPIYVMPSDHLALTAPLISVWVCIVAVLVWLFTRGRGPVTLFGVFWALVFWLPVSGIMWFPSAPLADRYLYLPAIGLWIVVADQTVRFFPSGKIARKIGVVAAMLVFMALAVMTMKRNLDWKDDITLFARTVEQYPDNPFAHAGLGEAYLDRNRNNERELAVAEKEFEKALTLKTVIPGVYTKLGNIRLIRGDSEGALRYYTLALGVYPTDKEALLNRGITFENIGRSKEAIDDFRRFLALPGHELSDARPYAEARIRELLK
ncbi:MAG: hypothetical protein HZB62_12565 [Nitrospirae bacterium]|nr:hypothetical protein [Nitrospirota bacterium]